MNEPRSAAARAAAIALGALLLQAAGAAADAVKPQPSAIAPSGEEEAATYDRCMTLARQNPAAAQSLAQSWQARGGAHPADHCAAVALIGLKKYREGATRLETLAKAMDKAPAALRAEVFDQAGQAWLLAGEAARAYAAAGQATALLPNDPDLLIDRAEAAAAAGYLDRALADLDQVLKANPGRVDALIYRASAYRALDRLDPALADLDKALAAEPNSAAALLERGNVRRLKGDAAGARRDWQRVGQVSPGSQADMAARANLERLDGGAAAAPASPLPKR
jgi:tetratricopeptide (TPR) repeat protein